jgi:hypothetical protein
VLILLTNLQFYYPDGLMERSANDSCLPKENWEHPKGWTPNVWYSPFRALQAQIQEPGSSAPVCGFNQKAILLPT